MFSAGSSNMPMSPADLHGMWYPTVRRTLVCLSKLYRCIDVSRFSVSSRLDDDDGDGVYYFQTDVLVHSNSEC